MLESTLIKTTSEDELNSKFGLIRVQCIVDQNQPRVSLVHDFDQAQHHLSKIDCNADKYCFQTFTDSKQKQVPDKLARTFYGSFEEHKGTLALYNNQGAGVFVTVNETEGKGRKKTDIKRIRAVWVEDDNGDAPELPVRPHMKIESSLGKYHSYIFTDTDKVDEFEGVEQRLVDDYGSDPNAKDRSRVLRLAGFYHQKNPEKPFLVRIVSERNEKPLDWETLKELFPPVNVPIKNNVVTIKTSKVEKCKFNAVDCRSALEAIDPDLDYKDWLRIGMALYSSGEGEVAFKLWDDWSQKGVKYRPGDCELRWNSFSNDNMISLKSLFFLARNAGWTKQKSISRISNTHDAEILENFVFISSLDRFFNVNTGKLLTKESFSATWLHVYQNPKAAIWLLSNGNCVKVDDLIYLPGETMNPVRRDRGLFWNTWSPPDIILPVVATNAEVELWLDHLNYLYPDKNEQKHLLDWFGFMLQFPQVKINHGVILAGKSRVGKDMLLNPIRYSLGASNVSEPSATELNEQYTNYLNNTKLVIFQEIRNFDGVKLENKLKPMLAAPPDTLNIRMFGLGFHETPNIVQVIFMSNYQDAIHISKGDGRYFALWADVDPLDDKYYTKLANWLEEDGNGLVVRWLLERDISSFNPKAPPPMTNFKQAMVQESRSPLKQQLEEMIGALDFPFDKDIVRSLDISEVLKGKYTAKAIAGVLREIGCINKECKRSTGKREKLSLFAVRDCQNWDSKNATCWFQCYD